MASRRQKIVSSTTSGMMTSVPCTPADRQRSGTWPSHVRQESAVGAPNGSISHVLDQRFGERGDFTTQPWASTIARASGVRERSSRTPAASFRGEYDTRRTRLISQSAAIARGARSATLDSARRQWTTRNRAGGVSTFGLAAGAHGGGEGAQDGHRFGEAETGVGDALAVRERFAGNDVLAAFDQVAFDHDAEDGR